MGRQTGYATAPSYTDTDNALFGRIPDFPFDRTQISSASTMSNDWVIPGCTIISQPTLHKLNWWINWKEVVFYGLADAYKPVPIVSLPACGDCLEVYTNSAAALTNKQSVVMVAGKKFAGQSRSSFADKAAPANYLEGFNSDATATTFLKVPATSTFNDHLLYR